MQIDFQPEYEKDLSDPLCDAVPVVRSTAARLLFAIRRGCAGKRVVFDLDSTLLNNRPRNAKIMQEYGVDHRQPLLAQATAAHFVNWDVSNSMTLAGLSSELINEHVEPYRAFWLERFFTSEYCQYDVAIPGAMEFVTGIQDNGGIVCYLTGRDETMRKGTQASLLSLGFPVPDNSNVTLVMKPTRGYSDDLFKQEAMADLKQGDVLAAFDNEPTHINTYRREFPAAMCMHLFTDHSMREVLLLDGIYSIRNFLCDFQPNHE